MDDGKGALTYTLERKQVKNINLRIRPDGRVYASAHPSVPVQRIDSFVQSKLDYVRRVQKRCEQHQERLAPPRQYEEGESFRLLGRTCRLTVRQGQPEGAEMTGNELRLTQADPDDRKKRKKLADALELELCRKVFTEQMEKVLPLFERWGVTMPALRIRDMTSRWGSCIPGKEIITLNRRLIHAPLPCIEYVVLHEFCHFIYQDHSQHFHALMTALMPDWKLRRKLLEDTADF